MSFRVEYLVILKLSEDFCATIKTFNNLLEADQRIVINGKQIKFNKTTFQYQNSIGEIKEREQRFFQLELTCPSENDFPDFFDLLKVIRKFVNKAEGEVNTLWDDVGIHYSVLSYPIINRLENLLRKLISKFMLKSVGKD